MPGMRETAPYPTEIRLIARGAVLRIEWDDGMLSVLTAPVLRRSSRSSQSIRVALDGGIVAADDIRILDVQPLGLYAINLRFSDGYDRGVYPYSYLRELAPVVTDCRAAE